jgi:hypothetical protein
VQEADDIAAALLALQDPEAVEPDLGSFADLGLDPAAQPHPTTTPAYERPALLDYGLRSRG